MNFSDTTDTPRSPRVLSREGLDEFEDPFLVSTEVETKGRTWPRASVDEGNKGDASQCSIGSIEDAAPNCQLRTESTLTGSYCLRNSGVPAESGDGCGVAGFDLPDYGSMSEEEKLRRKLAFFFMNPVEKFVSRRQTPWKLILQFAKVIFVTAQLVTFGEFRFSYASFYSDSQIVFEHLFFRNWDSVREIVAYPPASGKYALYNKDTFYKIFNDAAETLRTLEEISVSPLTRNSTMQFCFQSKFGLDDHRAKQNLQCFQDGCLMGSYQCITIPDDKLVGMNSKTYLKDNNFTVPWPSLQRMHLNFSVTTVTFREMFRSTNKIPDCFLFRVHIGFDNSNHDGQVPIDLTLEPKRLVCNDPGIEETQWGIIILNNTVIIICLLSLVLCLRALVRAQFLKAETQEIFRKRFDTKLTIQEKLQFWNLWYVVICINDVLIILGTLMAEFIHFYASTADLWDLCCVSLGTGDLLVWLGMLRYLGFFEAYNALILTLKGALPNVARFVLCAAFVYAGYVFCGWLAFSPYHFKFRSLHSTSECLFSLVNGDDMFATFSMMSDKAGMINSFSRIYLYTFVMLFIYVILSLFIAIIMDTYENIKKYYVEGFPKTRVDEFYTSACYDPYTTAFYDGSSVGWLYLAWCWVMTRLFGREWRGYERMEVDRRRRANQRAATAVAT